MLGPSLRMQRGDIKIKEQQYDYVNIFFSQVYEWVIFFEDQIYDLGRFFKKVARTHIP